MIWGRAEAILREDLRTAQDRLLDTLDRLRQAGEEAARWKARYEELQRAIGQIPGAYGLTSVPPPPPPVSVQDLDEDPFAIDPERQAAIRRAFQEGPEAVLAEMLDAGPTGAVD